MFKKLEKAIRHFECMRDNNIVVLNSGFGTKKGEHNSLYKNRKMYAELAIEALEKQIPKKIEEHNKTCKCRVFDYMDYECTQRVPYCCVCGQKILWQVE